ncbi:hypothetical protein J4E91_006270 [Alternaria rosae]|nr:hypothetical protein J4E91_006270 [Alternaria rosae]
MEQREWRRVKADTVNYSIEELIKQPEPYTFDYPLTVVTYFVSWSLWAVYLTCRYRSLSPLTQAASASFWLPRLMFLTEVLLLLPAIFSALHMALYIVFGTRNKHRSSYRLSGQEAPTIDVCITCCGEKLDVIMDTVAGAAMQDYPSASFRVFVLDDGGNAALKDAVGDYNRLHGTSVEYLARTKLEGESHFYKAGNLRFGLESTENFGKGSEYFASLDVDMIAEPDWLRRVVPHLILDSGMALACPAQWHYNIPNPDLLGQAGPASMEIFEPMHDNIGLSHCFGSGYIVKRNALKQVGGWPKVPVGEDIFCSYMLAGHGWGIAFVKEFVQYGLTAGSFEALSRQRMRWVSYSPDMVVK